MHGSNFPLAGATWAGSWMTVGVQQWHRMALILERRERGTTGGRRIREKGRGVHLRWREVEREEAMEGGQSCSDGTTQREKGRIISSLCALPSLYEHKNRQTHVETISSHQGVTEICCPLPTLLSKRHIEFYRSLLFLCQSPPSPPKTWCSSPRHEKGPDLMARWQVSQD